MKWIRGISEDGWFLIGTAVLTVVIVMVIWLAYRNEPPIYCRDTAFKSDTSFTCINHRVNECLQSELYTREECIALVGGQGE